jgi:predicted nucleic acid-binding protein
MRLYLDANPIIHSIEGVPEFRLAALAWIERAEAAQHAVITSRLLFGATSGSRPS